MTQMVKTTDFRQFLFDNMNAITAAIRTSLKPATVCNMLMQARSDPKLRECTPESFLQSAIQALQLGLEPNNKLGHAYLVPYGKICTLVIGYKGMIQLAYRSGSIKSIETHCVYANEDYELDWGATPPIKHRPKPPEQRGEFVAAYCKIVTVTGGVIYDWMWSGDIAKIKARSPARSGPWKTDEDEMNRKTVAKRTLKYAPASPESKLQTAVALDDLAEAGLPQDINVIDIVAEQSTAAAPTTLNGLAGTPFAEPAAPPAAEPATSGNPPAEPAKPAASKKPQSAAIPASLKCVHCGETDGHIENCPNEQSQTEPEPKAAELNTDAPDQAEDDRIKGQLARCKILSGILRADVRQDVLMKFGIGNADEMAKINDANLLNDIATSFADAVKLQTAAT